MLEVILQILSILGIILLIVLLLAVLIILLVLFFPITYRIYGSKDENIELLAKVRWFFGLFRVVYSYPKTGHLVVKVLWMKLYAAKLPADKKKAAPQPEQTGQTVQEAPVESTSNESASGISSDNSAAATDEKQADDSQRAAEEQSSDIISDGTESSAGEIPAGKIFQKIEKIKYTILNIYDKIKTIWANIKYYIELLREENTKQLFSHVCFRVGKILKSIRPRHIKANIIFGTGSPDTTGYAYGVYGMLSPALGPNFFVTPDFEQAQLKGELDVSGHITVWVILINGLKLLLDKKLHIFIKKMKAGVKKASV